MCTTCSEAFPGLQLHPGSAECAHCSRDNRTPKLYSNGNNMDPGPIPLQLQVIINNILLSCTEHTMYACISKISISTGTCMIQQQIYLLQGLTQVEEMLISAVLPIMSLYRLPHGQYGYSGHVINLPQDIASFATSLPQLPSELDVIVVRKEGATQSHHDFRVRRSIVLRALQWLLANNIYYRNIRIDPDALALLPEDGDLTGLHSVTVENDDQETPPAQNDPSDDHIATSFVPNSLNPRMTEQETIRKSVQERQSHHPAETPPTVMWPPSGGTPINEFKTEGYISCAFPTLFPTGAADFVAPRQHTVTVGNYFKHLMMYQDGRFAKHPRFCYFGSTFVNTRRMPNCRWKNFVTWLAVTEKPFPIVCCTMQRVCAGPDISGSGSGVGSLPWDTLVLPTVFFTHSAADLQWPELARLICPDDPGSSSSRNRALVENPAIADWFFHHRIQKFIDAFYVGVLGASDYWMRFEWQHRGSPHVHGLAWFPDASDVEQVLTSTDTSDAAKEHPLQYIDRIVSTANPAILPDGSNADCAPPPKTDPHICNKPYAEVEDFQQDLSDLVATCQRHTRCSAAYCLRTRDGQQKFRFGYPKQLQLETTLVVENGEPELLTARNDGLVNSFNPVQLSAWLANVDMQYCVSRDRVIEYCAKYATKCEPRSQPLKEIFSTIVRSLKDDNTSLKAVQKLLINTSEKGTTQPKKRAICSSSYRCSEHLGTLLCSV